VPMNTVSTSSVSRIERSREMASNDAFSRDSGCDGAAELAGSADCLPASFQPVQVWGLPLAPLTLQGALDAIERQIETRQPGYFITANLNYAMLTRQDCRLADVNSKARFILADGMPLVWASGLKSRPLPERVAGSDLVPAICRQAAAKGRRVFLLGGAPEIGREAARRLQEASPELVISGIESPMMRELGPSEHQGLLERIKSSRSDILLAALGQPLGEMWLAEHVNYLGIPACVQIGASLDFVAGKVARAPRWMQAAGLEWAWRFGCEPRRLAGRYLRNAGFLMGAVARDLFRRNH